MTSVDLTVSPTRSDDRNTSSWRDMIGIVASIGCAIHCAAMPFVIAYLPALGLSFLADESFHKWMALFCFLIAIAAFLPGLRSHGSWFPIGLGSFGLALITYAAFGLAGECCPSCDATAASVKATASLGESECQYCEHCQTEELANSKKEIALVSGAGPSSKVKKVSGTLIDKSALSRYVFCHGKTETSGEGWCHLSRAQSSQCQNGDLFKGPGL